MFDSEDVQEYYDDIQNQFQRMLESNSPADILESIKDLLIGHRQVLLEILVANQYISILGYLAEENDPPLLTSDDVVKYDLFSFFADGQNLYHHEGAKVHNPQMFRFLLDLDPSAVGAIFGEGRYLPIHIFTKFVADNIQDDDEFFTDLERLLMLGIEHHVGDVDGVCGFGGLFVRRTGSRTLEAPMSTLFHHFKYGYRDSRPHHVLDSPQFVACIESLEVNNALLESAVMSEVGLCFVDDILERENNIGATRNCNGRLPLHYFLCSKVLEGFALHKVIEANFSALDETDPVTGLFPFMLAASVDYNSSSQGVDRGLGIIYTLFRKRPILPHTNNSAQGVSEVVRRKRKRKTIVQNWPE